MKDILPKEMAIRDYVIRLIKETYGTFGFTSMETPCVEHIENLNSKQGGENEKLIFKILKRGEKLKLETAEKENDLVDSGLRYDLTVPLCVTIPTTQTSFRPRSKHFRWEMYGVQTVRREEDTASSCSAISISSASRPTLQRLS